MDLRELKALEADDIRERVRAAASLLNMAPKRFDECSAGPGGVIRNINKVTDRAFFESRYDQAYTQVRLSADRWFAHTVTDVDEASTAYVVDVSSEGKGFLGSVVKEVFHRERGNVDIIIYVGSLLTTPTNLQRVPRRFEPKNIYMAGRILIDEALDDRVFELSNWKVNLSNFDVV